MAKKSILQREKKRQTLVKKHSTIRSFLKKSIKTANFFEEKMNLYYKMQKLPRNSSLSRLI
jgi:small subunit ribosomal protein S14